MYKSSTQKHRGIVLAQQNQIDDGDVVVDAKTNGGTERKRPLSVPATSTVAKLSPVVVGNGMTMDGSDDNDRDNKRRRIDDAVNHPPTPLDPLPGLIGSSLPQPLPFPNVLLAPPPFPASPGKGIVSGGVHPISSNRGQAGLRAGSGVIADQQPSIFPHSTTISQMAKAQTLSASSVTAPQRQSSSPNVSSHNLPSNAASSNPQQHDFLSRSPQQQQLFQQQQQQQQIQFLMQHSNPNLPQQPHGSPSQGDFHGQQHQQQSIQSPFANPQQQMESATNPLAVTGNAPQFTMLPAGVQNPSVGATSSSLTLHQQQQQQHHAALQAQINMMMIGQMANSGPMNMMMMPPAMLPSTNNTSAIAATPSTPKLTATIKPKNLETDEPPQHLPPSRDDKIDVASMAAAGKSTSSCRPPILLFMSFDTESLSEAQCLIRKQIELFDATTLDLESAAKGRNKPISLGQVGIRCRHCAILPPKNRSRGATYYPTKLSGLYQAAQTMAKEHLCKHCSHIPRELRDELDRLRERKSSAGGGKNYWADSLKVLGVIEDESGLRFRS